ncbi:MAG: protoporphyrinogen oxidase [Myxococcota bacterium]|nr:protoporphyrinogen oxidase [Myxococcota bacterium]
MSASDLDAVVVGAGASGLAAAAALQRAGRSVEVFDPNPHAGGVARSERRDGYCFERGPNTFRVPAATAAFLREHGLDSALAPALPASRERFLVRGGRLVPVPMGPLALARSELLSTRGKLRLLREPFVRRGDPTGESVAEFVARRLGREALDALVGPFLTGVYAGDETQLGAEAVFPSLADAERRRGSIVLGMLTARSERGLTGTWSGLQGVASLLAPLAERLGEALALRHRVCTINFDSGVYQVEVEGESGSRTVRAQGLVLAAPAPVSATLLRPLDAEAAAALDAIQYAPLASVSLGVDPTQVREGVRGFGYLVPRGEGDALLGCLFPSQLFAGRAPHGRELLTLLAGGMRRPEAADWPDDQLVPRLLDEVDRVLGLRAEPQRLGITRWPRAVPQPGRDHPRRVAGLRARLRGLPALELAGSHLDGVAFADAIASGAAAAARLLESAPPRRRAA